ncbi:hypothetical protein QVD17_15251 [Tagetes erecta]|uniref:Transmembrane protein n=1 Tax=Tagetes erecta TaxID=13708 RepID=A0AAD8KNW3_TARER|nr:hypothetical protein QVD17_15251 [Tagetes erecta]
MVVHRNSFNEVVEVDSGVVVGSKTVLMVMTGIVEFVVVVVMGGVSRSENVFYLYTNFSLTFNLIIISPTIHQIRSSSNRSPISFFVRSITLDFTIL